MVVKPLRNNWMVQKVVAGYNSLIKVVNDIPGSLSLEKVSGKKIRR